MIPTNYTVCSDSVVMPWYRNTEQPNFYYVAEVGLVYSWLQTIIFHVFIQILEDMNPSSSFPDENFTTFNEYFEKKYDLQIFDQNQALLDVDYTSR